MSESLSASISRDSSRCPKCGRWYWFEAGHGHGCAKCLDTLMDKLREERDALERSNRSLRGAITRMRKLVSA